MLLSDKIEVSWHRSNKDHYVSRGYIFTKIRTNLEVKVADLTHGSSVYILFQCDYCEGENQTTEKSKKKMYSSYLKSKSVTGKDCCNHPHCRGKKIKESKETIGVNPDLILGNKFPQLIDEWSSRNETTPFDYSFGDATVVWWDCPKCKSEYDMKINGRTGQGMGCPFCSGVRVNETNSLLSLKPHIAKEWHPTLNGDLTPDIVTCSNTRRIWWKCDKGHEFEQSIGYRTRKDNRCPYCFGRKINFKKSLLYNCPEIVKQIHPSLNDGFDPALVGKGSNKKIWWICEKGHKWKTSIYDRIYYKTNCPYCSNRKICEDNCLANINPELAKEWNSELNGDLTPFKVGANTRKKVWWKCNNCNFNWKTGILNRKYGNGCPNCNASKGEKRVSAYLDINVIEYTYQYVFKNLKGVGGKGLKFDFAIFNNENKLTLLIEYDGEYHFNKIYEDDGHEIIVEHDKRKNKYCEENNIPLLRIPYWEFDNIESILDRELS